MHEPAEPMIANWAIARIENHGRQRPWTPWRQREPRAHRCSWHHGTRKLGVTVVKHEPAVQRFDPVDRELADASVWEDSVFRINSVLSAGEHRAGVLLRGLPDWGPSCIKSRVIAP